MKSIETFTTEQEAAIYSLSLKELGIESKIIKNDGGPYPTLTNIYGYSLVVNDEDYLNAVQHISKNMDINIKEKSDKLILPESLQTKPASIKWYLYGGLIIGIMIGLIGNWLYSSFHYKFKNDTKYYYHNGELTKMIKDRNHDGKDDYWQIFHGDYDFIEKMDNNYDEKIDCWWKQTDVDKGIEEVDCDSNEIPDITYYFTNEFINKAFIHPNNSKRNIIYREYNPLGICVIEYIDSDSSTKFDIKRTYDNYGFLKKEEKIKDTIINHF